MPSAVIVRPLHRWYRHKVSELVHWFDCHTLANVPAGRLEPVDTLNGVHPLWLASCCHSNYQSAYCSRR
jgi:hypothetical protein